MANVLFAAKTTTVTALNTVSRTATMIDRSVTIADNYLSAVEAHSADYAERAKIDLKHDSQNRLISKRRERALEHAQAHLALEEQLSGNQRLSDLYDEYLVELEKAETTRDSNVTQIAAE